MKLNILSIVMLSLAAVFISCGAGKSDKEVDTSVIENSATADNPTGNPDEMPEITFDKTEHDFGTIIEGETVEYTFRFTNTGKAPLIITNVFADCGCTVPQFPKEAIEPGKSENIQVKFNSTDKSGENRKKVTIESNAKEPQMYIYIKTTVTTP